MSFGHPLLLLVLLALPVLAAVYLYLERRPPRYAMTYPNVDLLIAGHARTPGPAVRSPAARAARASPGSASRSRGRTGARSSRRTTRRSCSSIDVSGSMQARDVKPTRLAAAQAAVRQVPETRAAAGQGRADRLRRRAPGRRPADDRPPPRPARGSTAFDYFGGFGGTAIGDALAAAVELVKPPPPSGVQTIAYTVAARRRRRRARVTILFLSDGHQTRGLLQPLEGAARASAGRHPRVHDRARDAERGARPRPGRRRRLRRSAAAARRCDLRAAHPGPAGPGHAARQIAQTTGGKFFEARSAKALSSAYENLGSVVAREPGKREVTWWFARAWRRSCSSRPAVFSAFIAPRLP